MNKKKDVLEIKPLFAGNPKLVNREMVIDLLDPRQEIDIPSTQERKRLDTPLSEASESDSDNNDICWEMLPHAPETEQETPSSPPDCRLLIFPTELHMDKVHNLHTVYLR